MNILHVTNMYPTPQKPYYGIFVKRQIESLNKKGVNCKVKCIGKDFGGYGRIFAGKDTIDWADLIHCHFGHTGSLALLWKFIKKKPIVVSYCGDDLLGEVAKDGKYSLKGKFFAFLNSFLSKYIDYAIVQSGALEKKVRSRNKKKLPYGTDVDKFREIDKKTIAEKKMVLFLGQEDVPVKNFSLLQKALEYLGSKFTHCSFGNVDDKDIVQLINNADVCVLTSLHEGSPNAIREVMACNRPIVFVDVGDVKEILDHIEGCFVAGYDPKEIADAIRKAVNFKKVNTRQRLLDLGLDLNGTADRLIKIYKDVIKR